MDFSFALATFSEPLQLIVMSIALPKVWVLVRAGLYAISYAFTIAAAAFREAKHDHGV
jgi:hypothetical protein